MRLLLFFSITAVTLIIACNKNAEFPVIQNEFIMRQSSPVITQESPGFPYPALSVQCCPETVMPGDTICYVIAAKNPHDESIYILDSFWAFSVDIQTCLKDSEGQEQKLLFESGVNIEIDRDLSFAEIKPGNSRIIGALAICVPPLDDLKEPFWEKHLTKLPADGEEFSLCVTVYSWSSANEKGGGGVDNLPFVLEIPITIKPRPEKEMAMIESWYNKTPRELFPAPSDMRSQRKVPLEFTIPESNIIRVQNKKYSQWHFIRLGNRYPGDPNAPKTWQGWKKLEDSLAPSTMRDEIRLTRILIQYCDTKDDVVLKELKEWFDGMNEVQRTVMAKNICVLAQSCYGNDILLPLFRDIYHTIRKYDVAEKPESSEEASSE